MANSLLVSIAQVREEEMQLKAYVLATGELDIYLETQNLGSF